jgi:hypothetical protein
VHVRFSPDRGFGLIRNMESRRTILTINDLLEGINSIAAAPPPLRRNRTVSARAHSTDKAPAATKPWSCHGYVVPDSAFRHFKELFDGTSLRALDGIKKLNIAEIRYRRGSGHHTCEVSYRLANSDDFVEVKVLAGKLSKKMKEAGHTSLQWPDGTMLRPNSLPPAIQRTPLTWDRWESLVNAMEAEGDATEVDKELWRSLVHLPKPVGKKKGSRGGRDSDVVSKNPDVEPETTSTSRSPALAKSPSQLLSRAGPRKRKAKRNKLQGTSSKWTVAPGASRADRRRAKKNLS